MAQEPLLLERYVAHLAPRRGLSLRAPPHFPNWGKSTVPYRPPWTIAQPALPENNQPSLRSAAVTFPSSERVSYEEAIALRDE